MLTIETSLHSMAQSIFRYLETLDRRRDTRTDFAVANAALHYVARPKIEYGEQGQKD